MADPTDRSRSLAASAAPADTRAHDGSLSRAARQAASLIETEPGAAHTLASLAKRVGVTQGSLRREFERVYGISPHKYQRAVRLGLLREVLRAGTSVAEAGYSAGFGSSRGVYEHGITAMGMPPSAYRAGGRGHMVSWGTGRTRFGDVVVGATERGVCCVAFLDGREPGEVLRAEFPKAEIVRDDDAGGHLSGAIAVIDGDAEGAELPLHLIGTPFQRSVWAELRRIPAGETASYAEVAKRIGSPRAVRAVAGACAGNHAAVIVPCHRVVRSDGGLGGYKWGEKRKQAMLAEEKRQDGAS